jgi:hypothetical protein
MQKDDVLTRKINYDLKRQYGSDKLNGRQSFRIVWANDEFENRRVKLPDGRLLKTALLPKYPWKDCYLLEKSSDFVIDHEEIRSHNGYECIYRLPDDKPLNEKAVMMLVHWSVTGTIARGKNISEYTDEDERKARLKELEDEASFFEDYLKEKSTEFGLGYGEAVSYVGLDATKLMKES